jgi:hypothetical protein
MQYPRYCHEGAVNVTYETDWGFISSGLVIGIINNLQVVTTINYYTLTDLYKLQSLHTNLFGLSALVFTGL